MRFILDIWPDLPSGAAPADLLAYAVDSIATNPDLSWEIHDDVGNVIADDVRLPRA